MKQGLPFTIESKTVRYSQPPWNLRFEHDLSSLNQTHLFRLNLVIWRSRHLAKWVPFGDCILVLAVLASASRGINWWIDYTNYSHLQEWLWCPHGSNWGLHSWWWTSEPGSPAPTPWSLARDFVRYQNLFNQSCIRLARDNFCYLQLRILADTFIHSFIHVHYLLDQQMLNACYIPDTLLGIVLPRSMRHVPFPKELTVW